jgi:putative heme iron utilization protein
MGGVQHPVWLRGLQRIVQVDSPAAGKEWSFRLPSVPEGVWWKVKTAKFILTTSAVVANRQVRMGFFLTDGADPFAAAVVSNQQAAGLVVNYFMQEASGQVGAFNDAGAKSAQIPFDLKLQAGYIVGSQTVALDVGDQYSGIVLCLEENIFVPPVDVISGLPDSLKRLADTQMELVELLKHGMVLPAQTGAPT